MAGTANVANVETIAPFNIGRRVDIGRRRGAARGRDAAVRDGVSRAGTGNDLGHGAAYHKRGQIYSEMERFGNVFAKAVRDQGFGGKVGAPRRRRVVSRRCAPLAALTFACKCSRWEPGRPGAKSLWLLPSGSDQVGDDPVRPTPAAHMAGSDGMIKPLYGLTRGKARS